MNKKLLGIIGGMGTQATAHFFERLHCLQDVKTEQDYLDVLLYSIPSTPDRTAFITGQSSNSPLEHLVKAAKTLEAAEVSCITIPCVTSHYFYSDLTKAVKTPIINMLSETAGFVKMSGVKKVCLLATDGTVKGGTFQSVFETSGIEMCVPPKEAQRDVMRIIYDIKCSTAIMPGTADELKNIAEDALCSGAEAVILGCTELCLFPDLSTRSIVNTLEVLAVSALKACNRS